MRPNESHREHRGHRGKNLFLCVLNGVPGWLLECTEFSFWGLTLRESMEFESCFTVSEITAYIKEKFEVDLLLQDLWLAGEVSNFSRSAAGHLYFTLKDEKSSLRCVMWRSLAERQLFLPDDGQAIVAHGRISIYELQGLYQFYVDTILSAGVGLLHRRFEALKERLRAEGLFERKRPLPSFPGCVGVVTSPTGAALRDILHVLGRRYPLVEVVLAPSLVQGEEAPPQIVAAIQALNRYPDVEVIIVARGGGSLEELWAFNEERVARAIYASRLPVVCGVGHETDFTIADFVADVRAPTPSAAAEIVVPDRMELRATVELRRERLHQLVARHVADRRQTLADQRRTLHRFSPLSRLESNRQRLDDLSHRMASLLEHRLALRGEQLRSLTLQLHTLGPRATLERGYALVRRQETGRVVKSTAQVGPGDGIEVQVSDGKFDATVEE